MLSALALLPLLAATPGQSVFSWTDPDGTVHYTDDVTRVPSGKRPGSGSKAVERLPFPLEGVSEERWATDKAECRDALATVRRAQRALHEAEVELVARSEKYRPCHTFNARCYAPTLTRPAWEKECQRVPAACSVNVDGQVAYVEQLRETLDGLITWLDEMARWGCARPADGASSAAASADHRKPRVSAPRRRATTRPHARTTVEP